MLRLFRAAPIPPFNSTSLAIEQLAESMPAVCRSLGRTDTQPPENLARVFKNAGLSLFPAKYYDLTTTCSCPDYSNPCKHIAAVVYLMAEAFDQDPFLLFTLRGIDKEEFLRKIGYKRQTAAGDEPPAIPEPLPSEQEKIPSESPD